MIIDHIAVYVTDIEKMRNFYEKYFGGVSNNMYHNKKTNLKTYFLKFSDGSRLEIMTRPEICVENKDIFRNGYIHIAFNVESRDNVDSVTKIIERDGFDVISQPRVTGDGYYESVVVDPEGNIVEIVSSK